VRTFTTNLATACLLLGALPLCWGQNATYPSKPRSSPAIIRTDLLVIGSRVIDSEWPHTLQLVNAPVDLEVVEPGQCVQFGITATGENRDRLLQDSKFDLAIQVAGKTEAFEVARPQVLKDLKPEGGDFVTEALGVAGIKNPIPGLVTVAVPPARWCVPLDVSDGRATITGEVVTTNGRSISLKSRSILVKTFATARRTTPFKTPDELGAWLQRYYLSPDPAQLLPALRIAANDEKMRTMRIVGIFFISALEAFPPAADEILQELGHEQRPVQVYALPLLFKAGYKIDQSSSSETASIASAILPNPYNTTPDSGLMSRLDMLWSIFAATGEFKPVKAVVDFLQWREDYVSLKKKVDAGERLSDLSESVMRGVIYRGAGWSLKSLVRSDGLVADYVAFLKTSAETPTSLKAELQGLATNPAFDMTSWDGQPSKAEQPAAPPASESPSEKQSLWVEFHNASKSHISVETRIGAAECASNPDFHTQVLDGDVGWVLTAFATERDRVCYRVKNLGDDEWSEWHVLSRKDGIKGRENYQVTVP
jgi:hypothetical protein